MDPKTQGCSRVMTQPESGQAFFLISRLGSVRVRKYSKSHGPGQVESGQVGSGRVGSVKWLSKLDGSGRVGLEVTPPVKSPAKKMFSPTYYTPYSVLIIVSPCDSMKRPFSSFQTGH